ncbi:amidohydrolase family protein [Blastococcus montanus]|uniref:amidohydrolase family protein n=1 Tax=Blastococcus montanus TaxID=3144973 RepID=UPI00320B2CEC
MTLIDVHTHMLTEEYVSFIGQSDSKYELREDTQLARTTGLPAVCIKDLPYGFMMPTPAMMDYDLRLAKMDEAGVSVAILSLSCPQANLGREPLALKAAQHMNDQFAAAHDRYGDRIRFIATLPWQFPEAAIGELERAIDMGAVGVGILSNIDGVSIVDQRFTRVWDAVERSGLPVFIHPTAPLGIYEIAQQGMSNAVGFHFDTTLAIERMMATGFLDRYSKLRVIGAHAGGTLPFVIGRLEKYPTTAAKPPSAYLHQIYADSLAFSPGALRLTVDTFGADHVMYGSDYPHNNDVERMAYFAEMLNALESDEGEAVRSGSAQSLFDL